MKPTHVLLGMLLLSLSMNVYLFTKLNISNTFKSVSSIPNTGVIYEQACPKEVTSSKICSIEVLEKRTDFAMLKVHYHYLKGVKEDNTRVVVKANKGSHDNVIGTRSAFHLKEGDNTIVLPFGMYKAGDYSASNPYVSQYIMVKARGLSNESKYYLTPPIFEIFADYNEEWFVDGEKPSWR